MKALLAAGALVALAGCSSGLAEEPVCIENYSYYEYNGELVPSPETLRGYEDFDCRLAAG